MAINAEELKQRILDGLPDCEVIIEDMRGDGNHYAAHVVSPAFIGKTRVQQHKMVYDALKDTMSSDLHALALQTSAPKEK